jgi:hypothetical protein
VHRLTGNIPVTGSSDANMMNIREATKRSRSSRSAPVNYSSLAGAIRRQKAPRDFDERAKRAYERFGALEFPLMAAAEAEGLDHWRLCQWKRANVTAQLPDDDGPVSAQRKVGDVVVSFRREPRPALRETRSEANARGQRNHTRFRRSISGANSKAKEAAANAAEEAAAKAAEEAAAKAAEELEAEGVVVLC